MKISVLGTTTFEIGEQPLEHDGPVFAFEGRSWVLYADLADAQAQLLDIEENRYGNSARETPTGFGFVADDKGYVIGALFGRTIKPAALDSFCVPQNGSFAIVPANRPYHKDEFGLTKSALAADKRAMRRATR